MVRVMRRERGEARAASSFSWKDENKGMERGPTG